MVPPIVTFAVVAPAAHVVPAGQRLRVLGESVAVHGRCELAEPRRSVAREIAGEDIALVVTRIAFDETAETIDGIVYNISRPRNVGSAKLKGVEVSAQTFFSFLPGALAGFGAFGNFTLADSEVGGDDPLAGYSLQGVSKYNFNVGLLYDRQGVSARLVYTHRSSYFDEDRTGAGDVRPVGTPVWLNYVRPNGRLDFSIGYDVTPNITVTAEGSNILRSRYQSYINNEYLWRDTRTDDSLYAVSVRTRF